MSNYFFDSACNSRGGIVTYEDWSDSVWKSPVNAKIQHSSTPLFHLLLLYNSLKSVQVKNKSEDKSWLGWNCQFWHTTASREQKGGSSYARSISKRVRPSFCPSHTPNTHAISWSRVNFTTRHGFHYSSLLCNLFLHRSLCCFLSAFTCRQLRLSRVFAPCPWADTFTHCVSLRASFVASWSPDEKLRGLTLKYFVVQVNKSIIH